MLIEKICKRCGAVFQAKHALQNVCYGCRTRDYVRLNMSYTVDGRPCCPECGEPMVKLCNQWECDNQECSVIKLICINGRDRGKRFRIIKSSIMPSEEFKELEVSLEI